MRTVVIYKTQYRNCPIIIRGFDGDYFEYLTSIPSGNGSSEIYQLMEPVALPFGRKMLSALGMSPLRTKEELIKIADYFVIYAKTTIDFILDGEVDDVESKEE